MAPGPKVERQTPACPVNRPWTSAMKAAPCSCRAAMNRICESTSEFKTSSVSSPGTPKIHCTPSFSRQRSSSSDPFMIIPSLYPARLSIVLHTATLLCRPIPLSSISSGGHDRHRPINLIDQIGQHETLNLHRDPTNSGFDPVRNFNKMLKHLDQWTTAKIPAIRHRRRVPLGAMYGSWIQ